MLVAPNARISNRTFKFLKEPPSITFAGAIPKMRITFNPRRKGRHNAIVRIRSNDPSAPLYWFKVRGKSR